MCKGANPDPWHWEVDCPHSQSGNLSLPKAMTALEDWGCLGNRLATACTSTLISTEDPQVTLDVASKKITFLVDTGTTYSVLNSYIGPFSSSTIITIGGKGKSRTCFYTPSVTCQFESQILKHSFLIILQCPILLLGWDLLARLGAILKFQEAPVNIFKIMLANKRKLENDIPEQILQKVGPLGWDSGVPGKAKTAQPVHFCLKPGGSLSP